MKTVSIFRKKGRSQGFTLVELLTVVSIFALLAVLVSSSLSGVSGAVFSSQASDLANTFVRARAYAMANNTYVFVGIMEVNAATSVSATQTTGFGRIGIVVVATNDGSRGYDPTMTGTSSTIPQAAFANTKLIVVSPLHHYDNIHMITLGASNMAAFGSSYPVTSTSSTATVPYYDLTSTTPTPSASTITFNWPLAGSQYAFGSNPGSVIQFNPQGEAQIVTGANTDSYLQWIELDLVPTNGNINPATTPDQASILIDGASGGVSVYRP